VYGQPRDIWANTHAIDSCLYFRAASSLTAATVVVLLSNKAVFQLLLPNKVIQQYKWNNSNLIACCHHSLCLRESNAIAQNANQKSFLL